MCRPTRLSGLVALCIAALASSAVPLAAQQPDARTWYPLSIGDTFEYTSNVRGPLTTRVVDTVRVDGRLRYRVATPAPGGGEQSFYVVYEGTRVYHMVAGAPSMLIADFALPAGDVAHVQGGNVTFVAQHDTVNVLGARWQDVRQYRTTTPAGSHDTYFARGIGIVAIVAQGQASRTRLARAVVDGAVHVAQDMPPTPSGITREVLTADVVERLALLARVWGFAKYHHPAVTAGSVDWDAELFRVLPAVLGAGNDADAAAVMDRWLEALGDPPACSPCATPGTDVHLAADTSWLHDAAALGPALSDRLVRIHRNRSSTAAQRYVSLAPGVGNPVLAGEDPFDGLVEPDAGYYLLALFRYWNIIRYWFPYRDLIDDDWDDVLREFIPVFMDAAGADEYRLAVLRLAGRVQDTHAGVPPAFELRPPAGPARLPVVLRFIEDAAVVTGYAHDELGPATGLLPGDVIMRLDGAPVDSLVAAWAAYYPASNEPARLHGIAGTLTRGDAGPVRLTIRRADTVIDIEAERGPAQRLHARRGLSHDLAGPAFRMLDDEVAYLKLSSVRTDSLNAWMERAADAAVLVVDIRNYPSEFVVFALGGRLVQQPTPFAAFTVGDPRNPGQFAFTPPVSLQPVSPRYAGTVVVLVDESSISQSEYTAMALRAGPRTIIVGSTTAGADGNISVVPLPGSAHAIITGIGVFYPDRTPTQRIGIIPDVEVRPTIAGVRAGRDEVLEAGVSAALRRPWRLPR